MLARRSLKKTTMFASSDAKLAFISPKDIEKSIVAKINSNIIELFLPSKIKVYSEPSAETVLKSEFGSLDDR